MSKEVKKRLNLESENELARRIMGANIVFPEDINIVSGPIYSDQDLYRFAEKMPSVKALLWCAANGYALVAGPPSSTSFLEIVRLKSDAFQKIQTIISETKEEDFGGDKEARPEWIAIRYLTCFDNKIPLAFETRPNAAEMAWFLLNFYKVRGVRLFERSFIYTSSLWNTFTIAMGNFDSSGIKVFSHFRDDNDSVYGRSLPPSFLKQ